MEYGKIIEGNVCKYQSIFNSDGEVIYSPTHEQWIENGYFPIIDNRPNEIDGHYQECIFSMVDNQIIYSYNYIKNPINYIDPTQYVNA